MRGMVLLNVNFQNFLFFKVLITLVTLVLHLLPKISENRISPGDMWGVTHPRWVLNAYVIHSETF